MNIQREEPGLILFESALFRTVTTLIIADDHLLLVDPNWLPEEIGAIRERVAALREGRPLYLFFTHSDYDHIIGYGAFPDAITIASRAFAANAGKERVLQEIRDFDDNHYIKRDYPIGYPTIDRVVAGEGEILTIEGGTYRCYQAPGHNADGLIVHHPGRGILIVGDYLSNIEFPYLYHSLFDYRATLDKVERLIEAGKVNLLITGHGDATDRPLEMRRRLKESHDYLHDLERSVRESTPFDLDRLFQRYAYPGVMTKFHQANVELVTAEILNTLDPAPIAIGAALLHYEVAHRILKGYMDYYYRFKLITKRARLRFEERDWHGTQADARSRIELYQEATHDTTSHLNELLARQTTDDTFWLRVRQAYSAEIVRFNTRNIAETFFNSVYRRTHGIGADPDVMFVNRTGTYREYGGITPIFYKKNLADTPLPEIVRWVLERFIFTTNFEDRERDIQLVARRWQEELDRGGGRNREDRLEILQSVFYRNKIAYIVGRFIRGYRVFPFVLPLLHPPNRGILIDALLTETDQVVSIFSYHRSYFLADITVPSEMVDFLQTFMPTKRISELYSAIGFEKHGKTVFYRELLRHLRATREVADEQFLTADGIAGMVMYVFTMPRMNMVFKVIRDRFAPPKQVTAQTVKNKYELVKRHDRVGRMADSYLFEKIGLPRDRFHPECLQALLKAAPSKVTLTETEVLLSHVYVEKQMIPLNLFLETADEAAAQKVLRDYGRAIKQLAAANIFPGDLLLKNFGVTRVNRVVFYDYDEIELVTDCQFRHIPEPTTPEQEMASQPWYYVGPRDIFPEEFPGFLMRAGPHLDYLRRVHGEIFDADFWNDIKARLLAGEIVDVFPYRTNWRFLQYPTP
jgi:isocitrate dehydrogenase kinase/phosphatase